MTLRRMKKIAVLTGFFFIGLIFEPLDPCTAHAFSLSPENHFVLNLASDPLSSPPWYNAIENTWGGHVKVRGSVAWVDSDSLYQPVGTGRYYDGSAEGRLKTNFFFGSGGYIEAHYEIIISGGDTRRKTKALSHLYPGFFESDSPFSRRVEDNRRLMDLTKTLDANKNYLIYHRLDRLSLTLQPQWGVVRIGRQAITWGNGLLFNPLDLFNPFSPTDIERDYKIGDDLVSIQVPLKRSGDVQFLCVPRRNPNTRNLEWDHSSLAIKLHLKRKTTEVDLVAAKHYQDTILGLGIIGYVKDAAWRLDLIGTLLDEDSATNGYVSLVANIDYSWVWKEKNWYGFLEFYFNGLSHNLYADSLTNPDISERLARGELFTVGRTYLSAHIMSELHPLFNVYFTAITNLADPSAVLQPRATWDIMEDVQITLGGTILLGERGTEFGGFTLLGTNLLLKQPNSAFLWMSYFF